MSIGEKSRRDLNWSAVLTVVLFCLFIQIVPAEADTSGAVIEFDITEKIEFKGDGTSCDLAASPTTIEIINTGNRIIEIDSVISNATNGWELVGAETDFERMNANSKKISISANGTYDLVNRYHPEIELASEERAAILITARTGPVTTAVEDEMVANIVVTLKDMGPDLSKAVVYKYPTVDYVGSEETFDHSVYGVGITRTIEGADSIKLVFSKDMHIYYFGGKHTIIVLDKEENVPYSSNLVCNEIIVPGDTAFIGVNLVNPGGKGSRIEDIPHMEEFQFIVTFIPLDENGKEMILTEGAVVYDEDLNLVQLEVGDGDE